MSRNTTQFVPVEQYEDAKTFLETWHAENEKQSHEDEVSQEVSESFLGVSHEYLPAL
jgi:hypothetical protein